MPHRPPDIRLLTALQASTTAFSKSLESIHPKHSAYLSSLTAYAASSPPPISTVLLQVLGLLERGLEEGVLGELNRCLDKWREALEKVKGAEEDVGRIGRDREFLISRVIKAGGHGGSSKGVGLASSSNLSLPSSKYSGVSARSKMSQAQNELLACEKLLSDKEVELRKLRIETVKDALTTHFQAFIAMSTLLNSLGTEGMQHVQTLLNVDLPLPSPPASSSPVILPQQKSSAPNRQSSEISSLSPSQSASQIHVPHLTSPLQQDSTKHIYSDAEAHNIESPADSSSIMTSTRESAEAGSSSQPLPASSQSPKHVLPHKITEESLSSAASADRKRNESLMVVENPRFASLSSSGQKLPSSPTPDHPQRQAEQPTPNHIQPKRRLFGSIRSLFVPHHRRGSSRSPSPSKSLSFRSSDSRENQREKGRTRYFGWQRQGQQQPESALPKAQHIFPSSPSKRHDMIGLGVPNGNDTPRQRVTSDLTGSKRLKRGSSTKRSTSNPQPKDEWGDLIPRDSSDDEDVVVGAAVLDAARMVKEDMALVENERERGDNVQGWVESLPTAPSSTTPTTERRRPRKKRSKSLTKLSTTTRATDLSLSSLPSAVQSGEGGKLYLPTAPGSSVPMSMSRDFLVNRSSQDNETERERRKQRRKSLPIPPASTSPFPHSETVPPSMSYHNSLQHTRNDLLTIVESAQPRPTHLRRKSASQSHLPLPSRSSSSIDIPHAPRPVARDDLERILLKDRSGSNDRGVAMQDTVSHPRIASLSLFHTRDGSSTSLSSGGNEKPLKSAMKRDRVIGRGQDAPASHRITKEATPTSSDGDEEASMEGYETGREDMVEDDMTPTPTKPKASPTETAEATPTRRPPPPSSEGDGIRDSFFSAMDTPWSEIDSAGQMGRGRVSPTHAEDGSALTGDDEGRTTPMKGDSSTPTPPTPPPKSKLRPISTKPPVEPPTRRKSVRVSLQPSFSTTPPALDDDDDRWRPWGDGGGSPSERSRSGGRDIWEDSSDEDEEYARARRLLSGKTT